MSTYAIGDVQGCYFSLQSLLKEINFSPKTDCLWFGGDLVNRGKYSLEVLRFIADLGEKQRTVLGNHDFHLLICAQHPNKLRAEDTLTAVLAAPDAPALLHWLAHQHLMYYDANLDYILVHAGIPPMWTLAQALALAHEVEQTLASQERCEFLSNLYGNKPDLWSDHLCGWPRLRAIVNYCTRMRFCYLSGRLEMDICCSPAHNSHADVMSWFTHPARLTAAHNIVFGHWSHLKGVTNTNKVYALDTGCVWGDRLTALRLEDGQRFMVKAEAADLL